MRRPACRLFTLCSATSLVLCVAVCVLWVQRQPSPQRAAPTGNLTFRDTAGKVVATADVGLPASLPGGDGAFKGHWKLLYSDPEFPTHSTRSGSYEGHVRGGLASIDLNPGVSDSNVILGWPAGTEPITGTWYHAKFSGGWPKGTFSLTR